MITLIKSVLSVITFILICAASAFSFWIGGGEPFTEIAGVVSAITIAFSAYLSTFPWVFIKKDGH